MIAANYQRIVERIQIAAAAAGRQAGEIRLVVVTKGHSVEQVQEVVRAGAHDLGENYLEEAVPKIQACCAQGQVEWHMIGHVQSRKAREVCEQFTWVHSVDRLKLARRLNHFCSEQGRTLPVCLECNVSGEASKFGLPAWDERQWPRLLDEVGAISELENIKVCGLMTMAPYFEQPEAARPFFRRLRHLQEYFRAQFPRGSWEQLSMGMSADFEVAIQEGATLLRIGTAIMGPRE